MTKFSLKQPKLVLVLLVVGLACQPASSGSGAGESISDAEGVTQQEMASPVYPEEVIPPCTPLVGSTRDPCEPEQPATVRSVATRGSEGLPDPLPTFSDVLLGKWGADRPMYPLLVPHIVIRGTVQPGTFRCDDYQVKAPNYESDFLKGTSEPMVHVHCFAEVRVNEYLVGEGPSQLTVSLHRESLHLPTDGGYRKSFIAQQGGEDAWVDNTLDFPARRTAEVYAGKELVLFLGIPTLTVEAWDTELAAMWFVQRTGDDPPRAVSEDIRLAWTPEVRARLDIPLSELEKQVRAAATNRTAVTGGRIGVDVNLPLLVTDANELSSFYGAVGAVYDGSENSTVLPPPVPGDDQPVTPPANTGENENPNGTPPTPGDDQTPPVPGDNNQPPDSEP